MGTDPESSPEIIIEPTQLAGTWANMAALHITLHEFTLDFVRLDPASQRGIVVSRVSFSPLLAAQLVDLLNEQWQAYTERSLPQEVSGDDESSEDSSDDPPVEG